MQIATLKCKSTALKCIDSEMQEAHHIIQDTATIKCAVQGIQMSSCLGLGGKNGKKFIMSKGKKMGLGDFLQQDSWADDMTDLLPTAPEKETTRMEKRDYRPSLPIPNHPPFNAFIGNLAFGVTDRDIEVFLGDLAIKSIRLITDQNQQPKGFGYVEFEDRESLEAALKMSGETLLNRAVRVSVADDAIKLAVYSLGAQVCSFDLESTPSNFQDRPKVSSGPKPNPFGDAKPRDELQAQKKIEQIKQSQPEKKLVASQPEKKQFKAPPKPEKSWRERKPDDQKEASYSAFSRKKKEDAPKNRFGALGE